MSLEPWSDRPKVDEISLTDILMRRVPSSATKNQEIPFSDVVDFVTAFGMHTGVISGLVLTINVDTEKFDMSAGTAIRVDKSDPANIVVTFVNFAGLTGQLDTNLSENFSSVFIDPDTLVVTTEANEPNSISDINNRIFCGTLAHTSNVISAIIDNPIIAYASSNSEMIEMVLGGGVTVRGGLVTANSTNLKLDIADAILEMYGRGRQFDPGAPNTAEIPAQIPIPVGNFFKIFEDTFGDLVIDSVTNDLDPAQFNEDGLGTLVAVSPTSRFTVQRAFYSVFPTGFSRFIIYYGTKEYSSAAEALAAVETTFKENEVTVRLAPIANIAIRGNVTDIAAGLVTDPPEVVIQPVLRRV